MAVDRTKGILTEQQFNSSPFKGVVSYQDYLTKALKFGSAFTVQHLYALKESQELSERIKGSVKGWQLEKEAQKNAAEEEYYAAVAQMHDMKTTQEEAYQIAARKLASYGQDSSEFDTAYTQYKDSIKTYSDAETNWKIARDKFNNANKVAHNAFFTAQGLE